jgi:hypothetical protein
LAQYAASGMTKGPIKMRFENLAEYKVKQAFLIFAEMM